LLHPRFDVAAVLDAIALDRATVLNGVPTMWTALAAYPGIETRDLSSLRVASSGGAPLPLEIASRIEALTGHRLGGGWGMTETSPAGTNLLPGRKVEAGAIGLPLPGIVLQVVDLDDPRRVLAQGEIGELRISGPNVTPGYWNRPEETALAFVDGFFLTGDVGVMAADGQFTLVDRKKDMILSGGFNVYPRIVEDAIYEHPDVAEAAVVGVPDAYRGQAARAFVTLRPGAEPLTLEALRAFLAERIGRHEIPTSLELRDSLPKTSVGKLSRRDLVSEKG
jgi:long-chain acyl-CoA synthetase